MPRREHGFVRRIHEGPAKNTAYSLFLPEVLSPATILFLHGAGETGCDGVRPTYVGLGPAILRMGGAFRFLTVFPQSHDGEWRPSSPDAQNAMGILDEIVAEFSLDTGRVHLTGISIGGYGTWSLAAAHPGRWASIVPICGGGDPGTAERIKDIPCWCFHGADDEIVPVSESRVMVDALRKVGGNPKYTEFPSVGHNSWDPAYSTPDLFDWMAAQSLLTAR